MVSIIKLDVTELNINEELELLKTIFHDVNDKIESKKIVRLSMK